VRLKTKSRDVAISDVSQSLEVFVERGDLDIRPGKAPLAKMDLETRSGNIRMAIPPGAKFELSAEAKRGKVENDYGEPLRLAERGRGKDGGATLAGAVGQGPALKLTTGRGTITIRKDSETEAGRPPAAPPVPPKPPVPPVRLPVDRQ
jgi:hypothetical protein